MRGWLDYWRSVRGRVVLDRGFARALWVVPVLWARLGKGNLAKTISLAFHPQPAGPWYTLPLALRATGVRVVRRVADADAVMAFDDRTQHAAHATDKPTINARCTDISKTHVGSVFADAFGYALAVDPQTHMGPMVEKADTNGVHDGRIVAGPSSPRAGCAYQRLVDTTVRPGVTEEYRCTCVGGEVVAVVRKEKAAEARFKASYLHTETVTPSDVFSDAERAQLKQFLQAMGLDFGSIDVLRDRADGRPYVVDVNKTCMPVLSLNVAELAPLLAQVGAAAEALIRSRASR